MKISLFLAIICFLPVTHAFFDMLTDGPFGDMLSAIFSLFGFLDPFITDFAQSGCDIAVATLGLAAVGTECTCAGSIGGTLGITGTASCRTTSDICLLPEMGLFCGSPSATLMVNADADGLDADATACIDVKAGFPEPLQDLGDFEEVCITGMAGDNGFLLDDCAVTIGGQACTCEVCDSGIAVKFDCEAVNIGSAIGMSVPGPKIDLCTGLTFLPQAE